MKKIPAKKVNEADAILRVRRVKGIARDYFEGNTYRLILNFMEKAVEEYLYSAEDRIGDVSSIPVKKVAINVLDHLFTNVEEVIDFYAKKFI